MDATRSTEDFPHATIIIRRPNDQVRPMCECGWLGTTCRNLADAEEEAHTHLLNAASDLMLAALAEQTSNR